MLRLRWSSIAAIVLVAACASNRQSARMPAAGSASAPVARDTLNLPRPGDMVRLKIWREPDLSGDFSIDETGVVVFPRIGPLRVTTESAGSLREKLINAYKPYLTHTSIDVTLLRRVQVLGAVRNPGLYPVDPTMTIGDAVAVAGGATPQGNPDRLELVRHGKRLSVDLSPGTRIGESQIRSGDQLYVPERNFIARNPIIVGSAIAATASLLIAAFIRN